MKKNISIVVLLGLLLSMTACGEKKNEVVNATKTEQPSANKNTQQDGSNEKKATNKDYEEFDYLGDVYMDPNNDGVINGPNLISFMEFGIAYIWNADSQYYIGVSFYKDYWDDIDREAIKEVEDIVPVLQGYILDTSRKSYARDIKDIVITSQNRVTINGREANRFEGYFDCPSSDGSVANRNIVGYSMFFKGEPMFLIGVVSSNQQEQEYKDTVTKTVDDMIKTLRDTAVVK